MAEVFGKGVGELEFADADRTALPHWPRSPLLPVSLVEQPPAALNAHVSATLTEHSGYFAPPAQARSAMPGRPCPHPTSA
jgi:hypothetical protein